MAAVKTDGRRDTSGEEQQGQLMPAHVHIQEQAETEQTPLLIEEKQRAQTVLRDVERGHTDIRRPYAG